MKNLTILVAGANGQLGKCLQDIAPNFPETKFHFLGREHFRIDHFEMVEQVMAALKPDVVINAAAYTAVDKAETETETAYLMNAKAVEHLAKVCKNIHAKFLHVSTDYVFNGKGSQPYQETDAVDPVNKYGASKLAGEELALAANADTVVVRTSWVYSRHANNFVKTMLRLMKEREGISAVNDQWGCPTYAIDLAEALMNIAVAQQHKGGIYHFSNAGVISWFQFAEAIQQISGLPCKVNPITTADFPTPAKRPAYSAMDCGKIEQVYGLKQKPWQQSLKECLQLLCEQ